MRLLSALYPPQADKSEIRNRKSEIEIAPRGFEPLNENQQAADNKALTETENPVFATSLAILLQKYPDLQEIISAWPKLPEHIKAEIKTLSQTHKGD
jgi:hypothetical protein